MKRASVLTSSAFALLAVVTAHAQEPPHAPNPSSGQPAPQAPAPMVPPAPSGPSPTLAIVNEAKPQDTGPKGGVSPAILRAQVMLDRLHASPGVIDGKDGANFVHALQTYERAKMLPVSKTLDDTTWNALVKETSGAVLMDYVLTAKDVEGPFFPDLPSDYAKLATMKTLGYRNVSQKIGAKFHMGEDLLGALNPGVDLGKAGSKILVAVVKPDPIRGTLASITVDKAKSQVFGLDRKGHVLVAYPATIGSRALPSPSGTYKVKGVAFNPIYYYDPDNFLQGDNKEKLKLPPGPNNPVGSVFMALTKPTYGLHGTPDPSKIDKTASHGCVRMTNWDAEELAHLVKRGIVVHFKG